MKASPIWAIVLGLVSLSLPACHRSHAEEKGHHQEHHKLVVTNPLAKDVVIAQPYVCQIRSQRNIEVRALQEGYLEEIPVKEGQMVKAGDVLFRVMPVLYKARLDAELAEANFAQQEYNNSRKLLDQKIVSDREVALYEAKLAKALAKAKLAEAEWKLTEVRAPFDGIIDRLYQQQGSLVKKEEILTTLSDNSMVWVYFNVPEVRYLEYMAGRSRNKDKADQRIELADSRIELVLANGSKFQHDAGNFVTVEGKFNNETGNIAFRADFPNPDGLLRHGQTGTVVIHRTLKNAVVIPQRATFEVLDKQYVWVVGEDHVVHQRPIAVAHELEDIYVIKGGLDARDKIVLEGVKQVRDGERIEYGFQKPEDALAHPKYHAE